jgi:hypothetical protein
MKGRDSRGLIQGKETVMSKENTFNGKRPSFIVWFAPEHDNAPWTRVGSLWPTKGGKGFNMVLDLVPRAEGSLVVLPPKDKGEQAEVAAEAEA